jgi:hypothetical protein
MSDNPRTPDNRSTTERNRDNAVRMGRGIEQRMADMAAGKCDSAGEPIKADDK